MAQKIFQFLKGCISPKMCEEVVVEDFYQIAAKELDEYLEDYSKNPGRKAGKSPALSHKYGEKFPQNSANFHRN